jgi:tRNA-2-methylthio-N6-dimethylallyladenosine synthase
LMGRTRTNKIVVFEGTPEHMGQIFHIHVAQANGFSLYGTPLMQTSPPAFA